MRRDYRRVGVGGSDARTHAIVSHIVNNSPSVEEIYCWPGNAGIAQERLRNGARVNCVPILAVDDISGQLALAREKRLDAVIFSPEKLLVMGAADAFTDSGHVVFGCNRVAARFEGSKVFSQNFARHYGVRFAPGECFAFGDRVMAKSYAKGLKGRCAVKADGLRAGKGVTVCRSFRKAERAIDAELKASGDMIVIQELLEGREVSLMVLCDGKTVRCLQTAKDFKRALDGDKGPMTGGMASYSSPVSLLSVEQLAEVHRTIINPWLLGCAYEGIVFRGVLYIGLMVTEKDGIFAIEFNVRLGDPEAEVLLPRLQNDFLEIVDACHFGTLDKVVLWWKSIHSVCVVMAKRGYPKKPDSKPRIISGLRGLQGRDDLKVFHAGTGQVGDDIVAIGGRSLAVTAWSEQSLKAAARAVYAAIEGHLHFDGAHFRNDIVV